ncbi:MAG: hypothetical protein HRF51_05440 [bacterium]
MADKKSKEQGKEPEKPAKSEIVGLDSPEGNAKSPSGGNGLKGFLLPAAVGAGLFALAMAVSMFLQGSPGQSGQSTAADSTAIAADSVFVPVVTGLSPEELLVIDFDTNEVMKELAFLDFDFEEKTPVAPEDSAAVTDSLSEIQKARELLAAEKAELDKKRAELQEKESKVTQGLAKIDDAETARIISLARLYDGMKAEDVAQLVANLDDSLVVAIIPRMKPANAAKLLALLPPKRAASISTQLITIIDE